MTLTLTIPSAEADLKPRITVFGVGGAGGNAVDNMIAKDLEGVEFVVGNTDAQALQQSKAQSRVQLGAKVTEGLGAGARPTIGASAAEESIEGIIDHLAGTHMCFITAGMGGGTGTGAAPIIAAAARELGVLTIGVVTKPFSFEGNKRMRQAEEGIEALQRVVDTLIIIPNQNLFRLASPETTFTDAFNMADDVLYQGVKGVTDLMVRPGLINLDFADVKSVMDEMGKAMMGTGEASREDTEDRAKVAANMAITNPLLDGMSLKGARGVLINVTGGPDMTLFELDEAANVIREQVDEDANIIVGSCLDPDMNGRIRVSVVATGIDAVEGEMAEPLPARPNTPAAIPAPVAERAVEAPAAPRPEMEPELFDAFPAETVAEEPEQFTDAPLYEPVPAAEPAYAAPVAEAPAPIYEAPRAPAPQQPSGIGYDSQPEAFVAPRAPSAGMPSPEAVARLQAAVARTGRPQVAAERPVAPAPQQAVRRAGLGSLIGRMTGGTEDAHRAPQPAPRAAAYDSPAFEDDHGSDAEVDRVEIPAFLRRQAN